MTDTITTDHTITDSMAKKLAELGVTDAHISLRLARTLIDHGYNADHILPTNGDGSAAEVLFLQLQPSERLELGDLIARKSGINTDERGWPDWLHRALANAEHSDEIDTVRRRLESELKDAAAALARAERHLAELKGPLYDVEYAEGGFLFNTYMAKADLALRTAIALNPGKES